MPINTIDEFKSRHLNDFARPNRFVAEILAPPNLLRFAEENEALSADIVSVQFPGKNIRTVTNETVYGPTYEMAQGVTYADEITLTFYMGPDHENRKYFDDWQDLIYNPQTYHVEYYKNYVSNIDVYQLDRMNEKSAGITLYDCFPKTVQALEYNQGTNNEVLLLSVGLAFREWKYMNIAYKQVEPAKKPIAYNGHPTGNQILARFGTKGAMLAEVAKRAGYGDGVNATNQILKQGSDTLGTVRGLKNFFGDVKSGRGNSMGILDGLRNPF
jgi:hypothetical protein